MKKIHNKQNPHHLHDEGLVVNAYLSHDSLLGYKSIYNSNSIYAAVEATKKLSTVVLASNPITPTSVIVKSP
jgi:hypothetical protein